MISVVSSGGLPSAPLNVCDEFALGLCVCLTLVTKFPGKATLQSGVGLRIFRMSSEMVSKRDMTFVLLVVGSANIEMMGGIVRGNAEGLTARDAQIALVVISQQRQFGDNEGKIGV
jgi:hypothetical protein